MFSLRSIFLYLLVLFLLIGGVFVFVSARLSENVFFDQIITERTRLIGAVGEAIFSSEDLVSSNNRNIATDTIRKALPFSKEQEETGVLYFRFIHTDTQQILVSSAPSEEEKFFTRLPLIGDNQGDVIVSSIRDRVEITYRGVEPYALWMAISRDSSFGALALLTETLLPLTIGMVLIIVIIMYVVAYFAISLPLKKLRGVIEKTSKGEFDVSLPERSQGPFRDIYKKFNVMIGSISTVRERDEFISSMKSDFITTAAHQLRTPLSAIKWAIKIILDQDFGPLNIDQRTILMKGYESNNRMIRLVNDLLDVDRIDSGRLQYDFHPVSIVNLINSVIVVVTPRMIERKISLIFLDKEKTFPDVRADSEKLRQVIQNLLDNAIKYSYPGGKVTIVIEERKNNILAVSVNDSGIGIPKDQQEKIFGKFFRAANARKLQTDGSGLGLYIMQQIIKKHNGEVSFKSEPGKGTTFTFTVPVYTDN